MVIHLALLQYTDVHSAYTLYTCRVIGGYYQVLYISVSTLSFEYKCEYFNILDNLIQRDTEVFFLPSSLLEIDFTILQATLHQYLLLADSYSMAILPHIDEENDSSWPQEMIFYDFLVDQSILF